MCIRKYCIALILSVLGIGVSYSQESTVNTQEVPAAVPAPEAWTRQLHVKTNAVGLAMAIANVAVEVDICKHLSFTLPIY